MDNRFGFNFGVNLRRVIEFQRDLTAEGKFCAIGIHWSPFRVPRRLLRERSLMSDAGSSSVLCGWKWIWLAKLAGKRKT